MSDDKCPDGLQYWTADQVAECLDGVSRESYRELWRIVSEAEQAGTAHPLGGDGSNGTVEEPVITSDTYDTDMGKVWPRLSPETQKNLSEAWEKNR